MPKKNVSEPVRKIVRAVAIGSRVYLPGKDEEDDLLEVLDPRDVDHLIADGVLEGDWSGAHGRREDAGTPTREKQQLRGDLERQGMTPRQADDFMKNVH